MNYFQSSISLVFTFFFVSLGFSYVQHNSSSGNQKEAKKSIPVEVTTKDTQILFHDDQLHALFAAYIVLKDALVASDFNKAKKQGSLLAEKGKNFSKLVPLANNILSATNLDELRAAFYPYSETLAALIVEKGHKQGKIYVQYCPMAFKNKGATWLSDKETIRNPYFGTKMLTCGQVKKVI